MKVKQYYEAKYLNSFNVDFLKMNKFPEEVNQNIKTSMLNFLTLTGISQNVSE